MEIKASVRITPNGYGFGHDWTLVLIKDGIPRTFWLGQDVKYCSRAGLDPASIVDCLGGNNLKDPDNNEKLAWLIIENIGSMVDTYLDEDEIAESIYEDLQSWELSCE
jgi:hypothetical protein